ncbi:MAG TPA: M28 family peptidase [Clostridia bacterium]|nr:M28 family peptidase [Clostridia bacterium]
MTELSRAILSEYQIRKGRRRKRAFLAFVAASLEREGIASRVEPARALFLNRNLVLGDPDTAKLIITAHYDTCAAMPLPNFITPKNAALFMLYQLALAAVIVLSAIGITYLPMLFGITHGFFLPLFSLAMIAFAALLVFGPANRHTANDNTSGVIAVLETALALPAELRDHIAFVLFDNEELGVFGSGAFAMKHPKARRDAVVLNLDCVSDGNTILLALPRYCPALLEELLRACFVPSAEKQVEIGHARNTIYPSDQVNFKKGVGIAALRRTRRGLLYLGRIHTARDVVFDEKNIEFIKGALLRAAGAIDNSL